MPIRNKKLLVEGNDDQHVILALCKKFEVFQNFDIIDCKGIDKLFEQIPVRLKESDIDTIGIIIDADSDFLERWNKIKLIFKAQGFNLPEVLPESGLISNELGRISIGIWIMPNNNLNGMLEDFINFLVPPDDSLFPIICENLNEIERKQLNKYKLIHKSKAIIHSWLSVQEDPGTPMGLSITKRYLTTDDKTCKDLIDWLIDLYK
jgi:hypothetical protein